VAAATAVVLFTVAATAADYTKIRPKRARGARDLVLVAGGDVAYPAGKWDGPLERAGRDLLAEVAPFFKAADLGFVNLEVPVTTARIVTSATYAFTMPPARLSWLLDNGINLVSLANNHMEDAGVPGIEETLRTLRRASRTLRFAGVSLGKEPPGGPVYFTPKGKKLKVAFLAAAYRGGRHMAVADDAFVESVRASRKKAQIVIVSVHHGREYLHEPPRGTQRLFRRLVDAGAHVVLGHHPHVIQGIERRGADGIIFYSLGNLSFGSKTTRHRATGALMYGMLPMVEWRDGRLNRVEVVPLYVNNSESMVVTRSDGHEERLRPTAFRPQVLRGVFAETVIDALVGWSAAIPGNATPIHKRPNRAIIRFDD